MQNGWYTGATLRHVETGTARPICNPSSEGPHQFRPRTAGPLIQRSKMEQGCPSIDTHQEWSEHSAIGSGFQNLSRDISKAMGKHKREERGNLQKRVGVFCYCVFGNGTQLCGCSTDDLYIWIFVLFWSSEFWQQRLGDSLLWYLFVRPKFVNLISCML